jgi:hypothetical protein
MEPYHVQIIWDISGHLYITMNILLLLETATGRDSRSVTRPHPFGLGFNFRLSSRCNRKILQGNLGKATKSRSIGYGK